MTASGPTSAATGPLNALGFSAVNKTGETQLRSYVNLDDDNDGTAGYVGYYSGNNATPANRPTLTVDYVVP